MTSCPAPSVPFWFSIRVLRSGMAFCHKFLEEPSPLLIWARWVASPAEQKGAKDKLDGVGNSALVDKSYRKETLCSILTPYVHIARKNSN
jgi:hypothetical protein